MEPSERKQAGGGAESAEAAMNRVLETERAAHESIEQCRLDAEHRVEEARHRSRRIAERTDARISRLHSTCSAHTNREVAELLHREAEQDHRQQPGPAEGEHLRAAVSRVAAWLAGGQEKDGP